MERQSKGSRGLEAYCKGGQGPPRAVTPPKKKKKGGHCPLYREFRQLNLFSYSNVWLSSYWYTFVICYAQSGIEIKSLLYCSNSCTSLCFKTLKSQTKTLKIRPYMFRSPLK
jgi:hypothetical protein